MSTSTTPRSASPQTSAKTSIQILQERNELSALLKRIQKEAEQALTYPEISFLALCRVIALARTATQQEHHQESAHEAANDERSHSNFEKISASPASRSMSISTSASSLSRDVQQQRELAPPPLPPSSRLEGYGAGLVAEQQQQLQLLLPLLPSQRSSLRAS